MALAVASSACIVRSQPGQPLRAGSGNGRLAVAPQRRHWRRQRPSVVLPAAASEAFTEAVQAVPDVMAGPPAATSAAADALAAAQAAADADPTNVVFSALFTIASKPGRRQHQHA